MFTELAPITNTFRGMKFEVTLPEDISTSGAVLINQMKSLDFDDRKIELIEKAPDTIVEMIAKLTKVIIQ